MKIKDSIILIVVFVVAIFLGVFIGVKVTDNKSDTNKSNQTENNDNKTTELSTAEAERIMSKYTFDVCGKSYITDLSDQATATVALKNTLSDGTFTGTDLKNEGLDEYIFRGTKGILYNSNADELSSFYNYSNVSSTYKTLFGDSKSLSKNSFDSSELAYHYYYSSSNDLFIRLVIPTGYVCNGDNKSGVRSAKVINNNLEIIAYNIDASEKNTVTDYKYVFKKANNNYYLTEITEIK